MAFPYTPVYATLSPLRVACPGCGRLILCGPRDPHRNAFNPRTQRLACPHVGPPACGKVWYLGILIWSSGSKAGGTHLLRRVPLDTKPTPRQIMEMRNYSGGFWPVELRKRVEGGPRTSGPVNRLIEDACTCAPLPWREDCPVHRWAQVGLREAAIEEAKAAQAVSRQPDTGQEGEDDDTQGDS
jgi:hypothetical protein